MSNSPRPWRELSVQLLATVMIPLTVAGSGLYYTSWQQNLSDLRTMIDLVSDKDIDRRKYGVAMFEYLLKNDRVPVEFVSAQLEYANNTSDKQLLPLMREAVLKAAESNPKVADVFAQAEQRLPSRLYVRANGDQQRACAFTLVAQVNDAGYARVTLVTMTRAVFGGAQNEIRVGMAEDVVRAKAFSDGLAKLGFDAKIVDLSETDAGKRIGAKSLELWFGRGALPMICAAAAPAPAVLPAPAPAAPAPG
jgi:hypothetical protein